MDMPKVRLPESDCVIPVPSAPGPFSPMPVRLKPASLLLAAFYLVKFDDVDAAVIHAEGTSTEQTVLTLMIAAQLLTDNPGGMVLSAKDPEDSRLDVVKHTGPVEDRTVFPHVEEEFTVWELAVKLM
jgi:hypothetical protein